jgi:hypothetical protein
MESLEDLDCLAPQTKPWQNSVHKVYLFSMGYYQTEVAMADEINPNDSGDEQK